MIVLSAMAELEQLKRDFYFYMSKDLLASLDGIAADCLRASSKLSDAATGTRPHSYPAIYFLHGLHDLHTSCAEELFFYTSWLDNLRDASKDMYPVPYDLDRITDLLLQICYRLRAEISKALMWLPRVTLDNRRDLAVYVALLQDSAQAIAGTKERVCEALDFVDHLMRKM
jgi:hypothetical protein